jgi:site-specific DNA-methyltransferase (adenine-specific)
VTPYYQDDHVTLYHGDCRKLLPNLDFTAIVTDPPYGMDYEHGTRKGGVRLGMDGQRIVGDDVPFDPSHLLAFGKPTVLWGGNHFADKLPPSRGWLVWDKRDGRPSNDQSDVEMAWTNCLTTARVHRRYWSGNTRTGREQAEGRLHVNQKPVALMAWCLRLLNVRGIVCDPYSGSGSTLVAAREMGLPSIGIDVDEAHCETIAKRLAQDVLDFGGAA